MRLVCVLRVVGDARLPRIWVVSNVRRVGVSGRKVCGVRKVFFVDACVLLGVVARVVFSQGVRCVVKVSGGCRVSCVWRSRMRNLCRVSSGCGVNWVTGGICRVHGRGEHRARRGVS